MSIKDILVPVVDLESGIPALEAAEAVAAKFDAHATALIVAVHPSSAFATETAPLSVVLADMIKGAHSAAALQRAAVMAWLKRRRSSFEVRDVVADDAVTYGEALAHARLADLIFCTRQAERHPAHHALFNDFLFKSGRPVLLTPSLPARPFAWERIIIGWNAKTEAIRAVVAALTVDAKPTMSGHGQAPGHDLALYLSRHGVRSEVRNLDGLGGVESEALLQAAVGFDADLVVLGAYGRSRANEFLFGGVTRDLLRRDTPPLLLAH
jgi:nucleotide-binding universal stress UspA family protein